MRQVLQVKGGSESDTVAEIPPEVLELLKKREAARKHKEWGEADRLRFEIIRLGWVIQDTELGPKLILGDD